MPGILLAQIHPACRSATTWFATLSFSDVSGAKHPILSWTYTPFQGIDHKSHRHFVLHTASRIEHSATTFLSICCSSAHPAAEALHEGGCQFPTEPTHSVVTLSADRPARTTSTTCRVCFAPTTLLSFSLQGFVPRSNLLPRLRGRSSHAVGSVGFEAGKARLRRFAPAANRFSTAFVSKNPLIPYPLGFHPL